MQLALHPWTSFVIVPLFALANAGIALNGDLLSRAVTSPVTIGIFVGYVVGKPLGHPRVDVAGHDAQPRAATARRSGWAALAGGGATAGIGFTVSLLIASLAFSGERPRGGEARGARARALGATLVAWLLFTVLKLLPEARRAPRSSSAPPRRSSTSPRRSTPSATTPRAGWTRPSRWSSTATSSARTAARPSRSCASCSRDHGEDVRFVWRHLPLTDVHPHAQLAAEAAEAAAAQGKFWEMHDLLLAHQDALEPRDLVGYAEQLGLDVSGSARSCAGRVHAARVAEDVERRGREPGHRARRRSSSTGGATTAPTTSRRSRLRSARRASATSRARA